MDMGGRKIFFYEIPGPSSLRLTFELELLVAAQRIGLLISYYSAPYNLKSSLKVATIVSVCHQRLSAE